MTGRLSLTLALAGCSGPLLGPHEAVGTFVVVSGPIEEGLDLDDDATGAAIAWAIWVDGRLRARLQPASLEPRLAGYAVLVEGPPEPAEATEGRSFAPLDAVEGPIAWGLPVLYRAGPPVASLTLDAEELWSWAAGRRPSVGDALDVAVQAATMDHLLVAATHPWPADAPDCRFDEVVEGLTVYRDRGIGCGGWRALAAPGDRTEFQGVTMRAVR